MESVKSSELSEFLKEYNCRFEGRRVHLSCLCDSTAIFLVNMVKILEGLHCTDIEYSGIRENDSIYGYRYEVSGTLPDGVDIL